MWRAYIQDHGAELALGGVALASAIALFALRGSLHLPDGRTRCELPVTGERLVRTLDGLSYYEYTARVVSPSGRPGEEENVKSGAFVTTQRAYGQDVGPQRRLQPGSGCCLTCILDDESGGYVEEGQRVAAAAAHVRRRLLFLAVVLLLTAFLPAVIRVAGKGFTTASGAAPGAG